MSDFDDKEDPNYFIKNDAFFSLPQNVRKVIEKRQKSAKHSEFYFKLHDLTEKI